MLLMLTNAIVLGFFNKQEGDVSLDAMKPSSNISEDAVLIVDGGYKDVIPSNTLLAVDYAGAKNFKYMKFDARLSRDNEWICSKSEDISDLTNDESTIKDYTYYELLKFDIVIDSEHSSVKKTVISSLKDILSQCKNLSIIPMIEVYEFNNDAAKNLIDMMTEYGFNYTGVIISQNHDFLQKFNTSLGTMRYWYKVDELNDSVLTLAKSTQGFTVCFNAENKNNTNEKINILKDSNLQYSCYNVNTIEKLKSLYNIGVRSFLTTQIAQ